LQRQGISDLVVNIHHFGALVLEHLAEHDNFGSQIHISDERGALLETGGALVKAAPLLAGTTPIVLYNVDVLTNLDLGQMLQAHQAQDALATLAIRQRKSSRYLLFDAQNRLSGWQHTQTGEERLERPQPNLQPYAFSGIHIINPRLLELLPKQPSKFSITPAYLDLAAEHQLLGYVHNQDYWFDVGKPERLEAATAFLKSL
jgi:NDP-sugar pyrophosphorylase family protein